MKKVLCVVLSLLLVASFMFFAVASSDSASTSKDDGSGSAAADSKEEKATYKIGDKVKIQTSSGEYTVKITSVKETKDRNEFSDIKADRVILVAYEYENISYEDDLLVSDMNMKLYDKENNLLEDYPAVEEKYGSSVGTGRKSNGVEAFALNSSDNYVELELYSNIFNSKSDCRFILEW